MKARLFLTAILALFASAALAGLYLPEPVSIDLENRCASGDMWSARFTHDDIEFIGCGVCSTAAGGEMCAYGYCQARDHEGTLVFCATEDPILVDAIKSITAFSHVRFKWEGEFCTDINVSTESYFLHKKLAK